MRRAAMLLGITAALLSAARAAAGHLALTAAAVAAPPDEPISVAAAPVRAGSVARQEGPPASGEQSARSVGAPAPPAARVAEPPRRSPSRPGLVRGGADGVTAWAIEATYAIFYLLSTAVLIAAGLGLLLPVLGGFALLGSLVVGGLLRRARPRAR